MDGVQQVASTINDFLHMAVQELTSLRLLLQLGLILIAAAIGTLAATLIRRRIDLTALTAGWPPLLRQFAHHAGQSRHNLLRAGGGAHARGDA
jgi:hypothetical protein